MSTTETTHATAPLPTMAEVVDGIRAGRYSVEFQPAHPPAELLANVREMADLVSQIVARTWAPRLSASGCRNESLDDMKRFNLEAAGIPRGIRERAADLLIEWRLEDEKVRERAMSPLRRWYEMCGLQGVWTVTKTKKGAP